MTFLFTDIEGSTKLAQVFHDKLPEALLKHNSILREATETNSGFVFRIIGDAFCCAFETSDKAIKAAVDAQMKLHAEVWGDAVIKVRMGIHSGYAEWSGTDYMGYITLARTNRVMSAAYGGQILVSDHSYDLSDKDGLGNISFRDLGERRLKDLIQPMKLFQVLSPELPPDFPPLKTLDARPNNLPVQLTSFIGREKELSDVKNLLTNSRLVTLLGPGGTGKTRLALQAGADLIDDFANGVWFADLAPLIDPLLLPQELEKMFDISEQPKQRPEDLIVEYLNDKELLIILDNCEHIIEACSNLSETILQRSAKVKILATSRESLRCGGELTYKVLSLSHPDPKKVLTPEQLSQYEAVRLFIERALAVNNNFRVNNENAPALSQICSQLDGIPLAIELAAARTKVLSLQDICTRLEDRFNLLTGGKRTALPRQKTLRALIDWSFDLLSESEKILWRRLSVFSGGWKLQDAEKICSDDTLDEFTILDLTYELIEKSVISFSEKSEKFRILETIRQYGAEKLKEANETHEFCQRHFNYYLNLCEGSLSELSGPRSKHWMDIFEEDYPNIQNALRWAVENKLTEEGNRLAYTLGKFWEVRGHIYEGKSWLDKFLNDTDNIPLHVIANSKRLAGVFATILGDNNEASRVLKEALAIFRDTNNKDGISQSLNVLGMVAFDLGDYSESKKYLTESLALKREGGTKIGLCSSLNSLGLLLKQEGDYGNALKYYEEALELAEELKDEMYLGILYNNIAEIFDYMGDFEKSKEYFEKGIEIDRAFGNKSGICVSLYNIAQLAVKNNDFIAAEKFYAESVELAKEIGFKLAIVYSLVGLGNMALEKGDTVKANDIYVEILRDMRGYSDHRCIVLSLAGIAQLKMLEGEYEESCILLGNIKANCESAGAFIDRDLRESLDKIMGPLNIQLGESTVNEKIEIGKAMDFEKIIEKIVDS